MSQPSALMPLHQALQTMLEKLEPCVGIEPCQLANAHGRILATPVLSTVNIPRADNSAMDGYACRATDLEHTDTLTLLGKSLAGSPYFNTLKSGECVRITTGAILPDGADAVMMQENTEVQGDQVRFLKKPAPGNSVRFAGEDIQEGQQVLSAGERLAGPQLGLLASLGIAEIDVYAPLKVALLSSGDELKNLGDALNPGDLYDSNRPMLAAMLKDFGVQVLDMGIIADDPQALENAFSQAAAQADVIISSGGVSVGEADYTKQVLDRLGDINFWKVAIKPGKPFAFGRVLGKCFFGLPGNPVSSAVTLHQLVLPVLQKLRGGQPLQRLQMPGKAAKAFRKRPGRADFQRGQCYLNEQGELMAEPCGAQGSGILTSITRANCFVCLEQERGDVAPGESVWVLGFDASFGGIWFSAKLLRFIFRRCNPCA